MKLNQKQGLKLGVLMLDTQFPRVWGDVGCAQTFVEPPLYAVVDGASVGRIVSGEPIADELVEKFIALAQQLERNGAEFITTSCGFLSAIQETLANAVGIPVISSSLLLLKTLTTSAYKQPDQLIAILTFDADQLTMSHLPGAEQLVMTLHGIPKHHELKNIVRSDLRSIDANRVATQTAGWVQNIVEETSQISAFVIECTNLVPYRAAIEQAGARPVYDLFDAICLVTGIDRAMLVREPFRPQSVL